MNEAYIGVPDENERSCVLTYRELLLLLQSAGAEQIEGIYMQEEPISDEEVILLINGLVKKGVLTADGEVFRMDADIGRMVRCMGWPERHYRAREGNRDVYCYERGNEILVTRVSPVRSRTIGMVLRRKGELLL